MKKLFGHNLYKVFITLFFVGGFMISTASAQLSIGGSYQIRGKAPKDGFGVRIYSPIPLKLPLIELGLQAHFSSFSAKDKITTSGQITYDHQLSNLKDYDYGIDAIGKVKLGLIDPYVGLGIGARSYKIDFKQLAETGHSNSVFYNETIGIEAAAIPVVKPFIEYRISQSNLKEIKGVKMNNSNGRWIFGIMLKF